MMFQRALTPLTVVLCSVGLLACGQDAPNEPTSDTITLQLNRLEDGNLEYCDDSGNCQTLPYDGDCVLIEVDVDQATGETCETCTLDDGTTQDLGCGGVSIGCVVVTLPNPDCIICAYVEGDIIFSTCTPEEPQCSSDSDCLSDAGWPGYCVGGECYFITDPCATVDCAPGFHCEVTNDCYEPMSEPQPGNVDNGTDVAPPDCGQYAICVADNNTGDCQVDADCPSGQACLLVCTTDGDVPNSGGAYPIPPCFEGDPNCDWGCWGTCEPVEPACWSDAACVSPDGFQGYCWDGWCFFDEPGCYSDADCAADEVCEFYDGIAPPNCDPAGSSCFVAQSGYCVPAPQACTSDADCANSAGFQSFCIEGVCVDGVNCDDTYVLCDMVAPICPQGQVASVSGGCYGPCVPIEACWPVPTGCQDNADCGANEQCVVMCWACASGDPTCIPSCESYCEPIFNGCWSDFDCVDANGTAGHCVGGVCDYTTDPYCFSNTDCAAGQICDFSTCGGSTPGTGDGSGAPLWCGGICIDDNPPPPTDCFRTGCSGEICSDRDIFSTCVYLPEYACFDNAACKRQADGFCGWTDTSELQQCIADAGNTGGTP